eukprot:COSAG01_NODE_35609_length_529_cov_1.400000_1_plen_86_part_10
MSPYFCGHVISARAQIVPKPRWSATSEALTIPFDQALGIHPEFVGMPTQGFTGKQADTVMLYFPLEFNLRHNISEDVARADLAFFA